jgi:hypothetical protein
MELFIMSEAGFTRNQRRQIEKLAKLVDKATQSDRRFFERRPDREHRLRRAHRAEVLQAAALSNGEFDVDPGQGLAWHVVVRNLCNGVRLRQFVPFLENADSDLAPEEVCKELFEALADRHPEIKDVERQLRETECGGGETLQ